jgi:translation elongation factor EF-G
MEDYQVEVVEAVEDYQVEVAEDYQVEVVAVLASKMAEVEAVEGDYITPLYIYTIYFNYKCEF